MFRHLPEPGILGAMLLVLFVTGLIHTAHLVYLNHEVARVKADNVQLLLAYEAQHRRILRLTVQLADAETSGLFVEVQR